jgi:leucyl-tRNA synthetase
VNGLPQMIDEKHLPIVLPEVEKYLPTEDGQPPLGNAKNWYWNTKTNRLSSPPLEELEEAFIFPLELNTMPGWAGSSWYWMRYMDAHNENEFASADALKYWENVDLYIGGSEHATGHLLYSRFWNKFLKDRGYAPTEEPFKKLINQGMILGESAFITRIGFVISRKALDPLSEKELQDLRIIQDKYAFIKDKIFSFDLMKYFNGSQGDSKFNESRAEFLQHLWEPIYEDLKQCNLDSKTFILIDNPRIYKTHVPVDFVNLKNELDFNRLKNEDFQYKDSDFYTEDSNPFYVSREVEKMSKSKYNVVNPDDICNDYGADTLRLYEMFLGPLEQAKPWNTAGITGVSGFLKKLWRLYFDDNGLIVTNDEPTAEMYKSLHKTIKKVTEDIENFSFNTSVSQFMICVNELAQMKCNHRAILEPLAILVSPYAPHIAEELWSQLGHQGSISTVDFPIFEAKYLVESEKEYPVSFNGKMRFTIKLSLDLTKDQIQEIIMADERTIAQLAGNTPKNIIIVPGKIINLVG